MGLLVIVISALASLVTLGLVSLVREDRAHAIGTDRSDLERAREEWS